MYRVMLADDEPMMRKALLSLTNWQELDCEVVYSAENGWDVIEHLEMYKPDILVTDIKMPGYDGIEVSKYIWEKKLPVKVIILTAYADFSYAQSAVKYHVVDYVTKTGVFDGLISALEQAKEGVKKEFRKSEEVSQNALAKNFFKSVFDGSCYDPAEIELLASKLEYQIHSYLVLLIHFKTEENADVQYRKKIDKSLLNFLSMVFSEQMFQGIPIERDMIAIIIKNTDGMFGESVSEQCIQIVDMMDNFMNLPVYIGISERKEEVRELKEAFHQAEHALENSFLSEEKKINFYLGEREENKSFPAEMDDMIELVCFEIMKGNEEKALVLFGEVLEQEKKYRCPPNIIKNFGILIQNKCRKVLAEYDKTIYEVTGITDSISNTIYHCRHLKEYQSLMEMIIQKTASFVHISIFRKKSLVYDCQKYIDENFESCIMVTEIADAIGVNSSYLSRVFKESTGKTIIFTLNQKKVEKAKEYLRKTDKKIYEIADALGFENTTYFSHFFKKHTGISPKDYKITLLSDGNQAEK